MVLKYFPLIATVILSLQSFQKIQSSLISTLDECPCVRPKGSSACIAYNSHYQAATLEEALSSFHDLRSLDPLTAKLLIPGRTLENTASDSASSILQCNDDECRSCMGQFLEKFRDSLNITGELGSSLKSEISQMMLTMGTFLLSSANRKPCKWLGGRATTSAEVSSEKPKEVPALSIDDIRNLPGKGRKTPGKPQNRRLKRQDSSIYQNTIDVDCRKRGEPVEDGSTWLGLCSTCWRWGMLNSNFFPQYVNQMTCDSDNSCLSGYAQCNARYRSITVLKNYGTSSSPDWREFSLSIPMACDCQLKQDSVLVNLARN